MGMIKHNRLFGVYYEGNSDFGCLIICNGEAYTALIWYRKRRNIHCFIGVHFVDSIQSLTEPKGNQLLKCGN